MNQVLLHLFLISGIGPASILRILKKLNNLGNLNIIYNYKVNDCIKNFNFSEKQSQLLYSGLQDKYLLNKELTLIEKYKIKVIDILDIDYPESLKNIYMPPVVLYTMGSDLGSFEKNISIVGSRKATDYALKFIEEITPVLTFNNYNIISGGALGADSMAHNATLKSGGKTIVILGSGLMCPYPSSNKNMFKKVIKSGGTLVSPFTMTTIPTRSNFPARNRIIAGLSKGCVVAQAAAKSGALITAKFALEEGRQVFALPGSIYDELSAGCHELIGQGAKLVTCAKDILDDFGENIILSDNKLSQLAQENFNLGLTSEENNILNSLDNPLSIDDLSNKTGLDLVFLQDKLFDMQLDGKIKQNFTGYWERVL